MGTGTAVEQMDLSQAVADFYGMDASVDPAPLYHRLLAEDPVHKTLFGFWVVSGYADAVRVLRGRSTRKPAPPLSHEGSNVDYIQRYYLGRAEPPEHGKRRGMVQGSFTPRVVRRMTEHISSVTADYVARARENGGIDMAKDVAVRMPADIMGEMLAIPEDDRMQVAGWADSMTWANQPANAPEWAKSRADDGALHMAEYLTELMERRRARPGDDIVSMLLHHYGDDHGVTDHELKSVISHLIQAGTQTTVVLLTQGLLTFARHPHEVEKLLREPETIDSAIEEVLRYSPPTRTLVQRVSTEDLELENGTIPAGDQLTVWVGAANRDPAIFRRT